MESPKTDRVRVGEPLPSVLTTQELGRALGFKRSQTCLLQRQGEFKHFELLPRVGIRPLYSGKKVQQWLDGELLFPHLTRARRTG